MHRTSDHVRELEAGDRAEEQEGKALSMDKKSLYLQMKSLNRRARKATQKVEKLEKQRDREGDVNHMAIMADIHAGNAYRRHINDTERYQRSIGSVPTLSDRLRYNNSINTANEQDGERTNRLINNQHSSPHIEKLDQDVQEARSAAYRLQDEARHSTNNRTTRESFDDRHQKLEATKKSREKRKDSRAANTKPRKAYIDPGRMGDRRRRRDVQREREIANRDADISKITNHLNSL